MGLSILFRETRPEPSGMRHLSPLVAGALHALALAACLGVFASRSRIAPYRLPGTAEGVKYLTYYSPGSPQPATTQALPKRPLKQTVITPFPAPVETERPVASAPPTADTGSGSSAQSGMGEGDISIALQTFFPYPKPNLSSLPHGTKGDVILNAVIDEHGKITDLTLMQGLGSPIDDTVMATVKQWSYTPAMRNGIAVPSEQELRFHYEHS